MQPTARTHKLTIQELADETLVFDHEIGKAHCLNQVSALVWKHCDGRTSSIEIARKLNVDQAAVDLALEQLYRRGLLVGPILPLPAKARRSRRDALRKLAAAAVILPAIMTISAPAALAQASPPSPPVISCMGQPDQTPCDPDMTGNPGICCAGLCCTLGSCVNSVCM